LQVRRQLDIVYLGYVRRAQLDQRSLKSTDGALEGHGAAGSLVDTEQREPQPFVFRIFTAQAYVQLFSALECGCVSNGCEKLGESKASVVVPSAEIAPERESNLRVVVVHPAVAEHGWAFKKVTGVKSKSLFVGLNGRGGFQPLGAPCLLYTLTLPTIRLV
jgi:hypothetical protein